MLRALLTTLCALATLAGATFAQQPRIAASARLDPATAAPGQEVTLEVTLAVDPGWHVYGAKEETGIPTSLSVDDAGPLEVVGTAAIPVGERHEAFGVESWWLAGDVTLRQSLRVPDGTPGGVIEVNGHVDYMACTEEMCDPPSTESFQATLQVEAPATEPGRPSSYEGHLALSARFVPAEAGAGDEVVLELTLDVEDGWHIYGAGETTGIPTSLTIDSAGSLEAIGPTRVPAGERHESFGVESWQLDGRQVLRQRMKVPGDALAGTIEANGQVDFMACTDEMCDPPSQAPWRAQLTVLEGGPGMRQAIATPQDIFGGIENIEFGAARVKPATARPGESVVVEVPVTPAPGWHVYGAKDKNPIRLRAVEVGGLVADGGNRLPDGEEHRESDTLVNFWIADEFVLAQAFRVPVDAEPGQVELTVAIDYQLCDETVCLPTEERTFEVPLTIAAGDARDEFAGQSNDDVGGSGLEGLGGLWGLILASIAGGLFALAMPCTYPMIPITISFFTKQADHREGKVLSLALAYGAGIVLVFAAIGVIVGFSAEAGEGIIDFARNWIVNLVIGLVFLAFALSLFGLFILQPPRFLMDAANRASMHGGYLGVFLMGTTLVITSFTCTAPVVGVLLATAASAGMGPVVLGMAVFGLTMAVPFVVLSLLPGRARSMPRAGEWMNTLKVFLGFVEVAAAMKFLSNADVVKQWGALPREMFLLLWGAIFFVAGLFLLGMFKLKDAETSIGPGRMTAALATMMFAAYCTFGALGFRLDQVMTAIVPNYSSPFVESVGHGRGKATEKRGHVIVRDDYSAALAMAREQDRLLLVNFTGHS